MNRKRFDVFESFVAYHTGSKVTGFFMFKAESLDVAVEIAKACPHSEIAPIEVVEGKEMSSGGKQRKQAGVKVSPTLLKRTMPLVEAG